MPFLSVRSKASNRSLCQENTIVKNHSNKSSFQPGICHDTISKLVSTLKDSSQEERCVVLLFDAMHLKKHIEYNSSSDRVLGTENLGDASRSTSLAQGMLVFMLRSIFGGWTQVIGHHYISAPFTKERLKHLLMSYLHELELASIECLAIICDQEPSHVSLFKSLGVTRSSPYIQSPISDRRVFVLFDPPHLLKSTRNNLLTYNFVVSYITKKSLSSLTSVYYCLL